MMGAATAAIVPTPDILQLKFDNDTSKGESISLAVDDINDHDMLIEWMTDYGPGFEGSSLNAYYNMECEILDHDDLTFSDGTNDQAFTMSMFLNISDASRSIHILTKQNEYRFRYYNELLEFRQYNGMDYRTVTSDTNLVQYEDEFIHVVVVGEHGIGVTQIYINNVPTVTDNIVQTVDYECMPNTDYIIYFGTSAQPLEMYIDELQIYGSALSSDQVEFLYRDYHGIPQDKMFSMWSLIRDIVNHISTIVDLIVLSIVITITMMIGVFVTSIIKRTK